MITTNNSQFINDGYDPKQKSPPPLTLIEKMVIFLGTAFIVFLMVLLKHPNILEILKNSDNGVTSNNLRLNFNVASLIRGFATDKGTAEFKPLLSKRIVGKGMELTVSAIGIGTHLGDTTDELDAEVGDAIYESIQNGRINLIDTSINYRGMRAEKAIGVTLRKLLTDHKRKRNHLNERRLHSLGPNQRH